MAYHLLVDTSSDTKACPKCGRVLPVEEFFSVAFGITSECRDCAWDQLFQRTEVDSAGAVSHPDSDLKTDFDVLRRGYRRYQGADRERILGRLRRRLAAKPRPGRLSAQAEAGYVEFTARMRKRRQPRHGAGGSHTVDDLEGLYEEQGGRCFYCDRALDEACAVDHKTPLSQGGTDWPENLCCACGWCIAHKGEKTAEEFLKFLNEWRRSLE